MQTENTDTPQQQTLSFQVEYDATVETTTEFPDPTTQFTYHADATHGSASTRSPWQMSGGMTEMTIQWDQQSTYTYFDVEQMATQVVSRTPKAAVTVALATDTVWVSDAAELEKITTVEPTISTEGENPLNNVGKAKFNIGGQVIDVDWNYESYPTVDIDGQEVAWPYIKLDTPEVIDVSLTEKANTTVSGKEAKVYEVTARMKQNLSTINVPEGQSISQDVEYIVKYVGVLEVKLVDVKYRKDYEWLEPHDNIPLASRYIVYRDRTYSTGETFTDVFMSMNCAVEPAFGIGTYGGGGPIIGY